ncbi:MAG: sulfite exporter TauE/SafE family protein [Magnetococcales bacterium]|nr:sulfite exporter TauE/SafE family protein [Magnetococcales bacterium]
MAMLTTHLPAFLLCGLAAGLIAGMFGVGGGIIVVPALLFLFHLDGVDPLIAMQLAVGTSLATIVITNISATWAHHQRDGVNWRLARLYISGTLIGAWIGSQLAAAMSGKLLIVLFGLFEIAVGIKMFRARPQPSGARRLPDPLTPALGIVIGAISSLFGIGGGTLSVPSLTLLSGLPMRQAVGTSSAIGVPLALIGALGFAHAGWDNPALPDAALGFFHPLAFVGIVAGTLVTTRLGVRLAHALDPILLKKGFGLFLFVVGVKMILK